MNAAMFQFINHALQNAWFDRIAPVFSDKDAAIIPGVVLWGLLLYFGKRRARIGAVALLLALAWTNFSSEKIVKNAFREPRPYSTIDQVHLYRSDAWTVYDSSQYASDPRKSNSFPSSHAANAAAIATVLAFISLRSLWATVPLALLAGFFRIYTGNHYPLDVLAGFVWGVLCGAVVAGLCFTIARKALGEPEPPAPSLPMARERKQFLWILGIWTVLNFSFVCINHFNLAGDEAQYWDWSRRLALGYYSKPPMIAYIIRLLTKAGGHSEWAIRSGAVLFSSGAIALTYAMTLRLFTPGHPKAERTALLAACATIAMPFTWAGSVLLTIDPPIVFFWALAMYAFHRAVNGEPAMWWLVGLALGLGMLTKYTILVLVIAFALYLATVDRKPLKTFGPYGAVLLMLLCMSGVLYWNATHDWVSVRHTASIGAGSAKTFLKTVRHVFEYFGAQAGLVSPILFGFFAWAMVVCSRRFRENRDAAYLFLCTMVLFGFYAAVAFTRPPQANWPVCSYVAAAPAFAWIWTERIRGPRLRKLLVAGVILGCAVGMLTRSTNILYVIADRSVDASSHPDRIHLGSMSIDPDRDPTNKLLGGREIGVALAKYVGHDRAHDPFIFSNRYQLTAWAGFYTPGHPRALYANPEDRFNQYDLWSGWEQLKGRDGIFVTGGDPSKSKIFLDRMVQGGFFDRAEVIETVPVYRGKTCIKTFTLSRLYNYSGMEWTKAVRKF